MSERPPVTIAQERLDILEKKVAELKVLMEISSIISSTLDFAELMNLVMERAKQVMEAEACSILLYNRETGKLEFEVAICRETSESEVLQKKITLDLGQGIAGWVAQNLQPLIIDDVSSDPRFYKEADKMTGFTTEAVIAVPLVGRSGLIGVAEMINPKKKDYDIEIFQLLCKQFAIAIENSLFHKESLERERVRQEMDIAAALQKSFLPESPVLETGDLIVSAVNICADKIGGDIYDFVELKDGMVGVLIGDVSGKGISAALYMAKFSSEFKHAAYQQETSSSVLEHLNLSLSKSPRGMFVTCVYMIVDTATGRVRISAAGHPPFFWIGKDTVKVMSIPSGPPLGITEAHFPVTTLDLRRGDRLLLVTDGVFDAKGRDGKRLGFENVSSFITGRRGEKRILETVVEYVNNFSGGRERADDLTLLELRWAT